MVKLNKNGKIVVMTTNKREIISVDPLHTAKTLVLVYLCFSLPIISLFFFDTYFRYGEIPLFVVLYGVFLNVVFGFSILWLACKVYNWVASNFGGIELDLKEIHEEISESPQDKSESTRSKAYVNSETSISPDDTRISDPIPNPAKPLD